MADLTPKRVIDIETHLRSRGLDPTKTQVIIDKEAGVATFLLYNLSGQLVGTQKYNPLGDKKNHNSEELGKYYSHVAKEGNGIAKIAVWGTETITKESNDLFVTEGIFDAIKLHNAGHSAIAVLTNNPKILKSWFTILPHKTIAIIDNDEAGQRLGKLTDELYTVPSEFKDLGDMNKEQVSTFLKSIGHPPKQSAHSTEKKLSSQQSQSVESKRTIIKKLLNSKVKNPDTGNDILVKTALKYDKNHVAYKNAIALIQRSKS